MKTYRRISIVIPVYNEAERIVNTIEKIKNYLDGRKYDYEVIIVDGNSSDNTADVVRGLNEDKVILLRDHRKMGKGYSVKKGMLSARNDYLLFTDADLSTPIEELEKFIKYIQNRDIVIASRRMKDSLKTIKQPLLRRIAGNIFPLLVNLILIKEIKDTQCGFKLFRKNAAKRLFGMQSIKGYSYDTEILFLAKKLNFRIKELPVIWSNDLESRLKVFKDSLSMFKEVLEIKIKNMFGKYNNNL